VDRVFLRRFFMLEKSVEGEPEWHIIRGSALQRESFSWWVYVRLWGGLYSMVMVGPINDVLVEGDFFWCGSILSREMRSGAPPM